MVINFVNWFSYIWFRYYIDFDTICCQDKKAQKQVEREERIRDQEILNESGVRKVEAQKIKAALKARGLAVQEVTTWTPVYHIHSFIHSFKDLYSTTPRKETTHGVCFEPHMAYHIHSFKDLYRTSSRKLCRVCVWTPNSLLYAGCLLGPSIRSQ